MWRELGRRGSYFRYVTFPVEKLMMPLNHVDTPVYKRGDKVIMKDCPPEHREYNSGTISVGQILTVVDGDTPFRTGIIYVANPFEGWEERVPKLQVSADDVEPYLPVYACHCPISVLMSQGCTCGGT